MARFNNFGATYSQLIALYPGTVVADYDGGGASGQTRIEDALGRISREVASAMTAEVYKQITQVDCEEIVRFASNGQTTCNLGLVPALAGTVHLWRYPSLAAMTLSTDGESSPANEWYYKKPVKGYGELRLTTDYTVTVASGAVVLLNALTEGERIYASYDTDTTSASYSLPSVADLVLLGAAAEMGARLYSDAQQEWKLVEEYRSRYRGAFESVEGGMSGRALAGTWIPDEIRALTYWNEVERDGDTGVSSVRMYRG